MADIQIHIVGSGSGSVASEAGVGINGTEPHDELIAAGHGSEGRIGGRVCAICSAFRSREAVPANGHVEFTVAPVIRGGDCDHGGGRVVIVIHLKIADLSVRDPLLIIGAIGVCIGHRQVDLVFALSSRCAIGIELRNFILREGC